MIKFILFQVNNYTVCNIVCCVVCSTYRDTGSNFQVYTSKQGYWFQVQEKHPAKAKLIESSTDLSLSEEKLCYHIDEML
jgi:hypothetical protein